MAKLTKSEFTYKLLNDAYFVKEYDTDRKLKNAIEREWTQYSELYAMPLVKTILVDINTPKSSTWGYTANAVARVEYVNGKTKRFEGFKASGTGYDKIISILEGVLNTCAPQNLLDYVENEEYATPRAKHISDGIHATKDGFSYALGGKDGDYFNFTIEQRAYSDTFEAYTIRFKNAATGKLYSHKRASPVKKLSSARKTVTKKSTTSKKMKGFKTAVWGKKPYRSETVNSVSKRLGRIM